MTTPRTGRRRRGRELEDAILFAAWEELEEGGWANFTIEGASRRAGASKATIYARWPNRVELVRAAALRVGSTTAVPEFNTGDLAGDLILFLQAAGEFLEGPFGEVLRAVNAEPAPRAGLENSASGPDRSIRIVQEILERAQRGGALGPSEIPERAASLGPVLVNQEVAMTGRAPSAEAVHEIVHALWLPVLRHASGDGPLLFDC